MVDESNIFSDFLQVLGVRHTAGYSGSRFATMPFNSLFGLSKLLDEYGVENETLRLASAEDVAKLMAPFIAHTAGGFIIVTDMDGDGVTYLTQGRSERMSLDEFKSVWDRIVLIAYPTSESIEPDYVTHARDIFIGKAKKWILAVGAVALFAYLFISNGLYEHWSTWFIAIIDLIGLWLTYMLVQKSAKIKNAAADRVCGVLEAGGCDSVLETNASKFFGIFGWSEVGFAYFSISLLALLMFPEWIRYLAACNVCCLPFTFWSIWYQKFRAKAWCTLCVSVQASLWLLFFCYLGGGWLRDVFPLRIEFFVLGLTYLTVLLGLNQLMTLIEKPDDSRVSDGGADSVKSTR